MLNPSGLVGRPALAAKATVPVADLRRPGTGCARCHALLDREVASKTGLMPQPLILPNRPRCTTSCNTRSRSVPCQPTPERRQMDSASRAQDRGPPHCAQQRAGQEAARRRPAGRTRLENGGVLWLPVPRRSAGPPPAQVSPACPTAAGRTDPDQLGAPLPHAVERQRHRLSNTGSRCLTAGPSCAP